MDEVADSNLATERREGDRRWGFWNVRRIGNRYLDRISIVTTPWFSIKLHKIYRPDMQRDLHNHPFDFLSIILWGWYTEDTLKGPQVCRWFNYKPHGGFHSIQYCSRSPVWTLVFTSKRKREWGFLTKDGFVPWYAYDKLEDA